MYDQLESRLAEMLREPRSLPAQAKRQIEQHLAEHGADLRSFLLCAADLLEEYELEIAFGPVFTPTLHDRSRLADLLFHWRPEPAQLKSVIASLVRDVPAATIRLPDGTDVPLRLHEVMVDRFVKLLRLEHGPDPAVAATLRESLSLELWRLGIALLCERGMTPAHQQWFADFVHHMSLRREVTRGLLESLCELVASQSKVDSRSLLAAAEALLRATQGTAAFAAGGHTYWSPDVAQHHQYRGEGKVDQQRLEQRQAELFQISAIVDDLRCFEQSPA